MMRQDPDVILVGEIRDAETAEMAFRAANDRPSEPIRRCIPTAIGAIPRLLDIGVLPDIMAGNVIGIIAQRLVRRLCPHCKTPYQGGKPRGATARHDLRRTAPDHLSPQGCARCDFQATAAVWRSWKSCA